MGTCCYGNKKRVEEYDPEKQYVDVSLHDIHKVGFDLSVAKAREKMGVETICEAIVTHEKELRYTQHKTSETQPEAKPEATEN